MAEGVSAPLYTRDILRLAASIPWLAPIDDADGEAERRSLTCGSRMSVAVRMDGGRVAALSQSVEACAFGQASAALMGQSAVGRSEGDLRAALRGIERWLGGDDAAVASWPGLAVLDPARSRMGRHGAILLPFVTLLAALESAQ
ncbi:MAG: iron-sulfur cluster assembly scaffold protein [Pseudomonadota bacterium]|nr:iron-sulfur cluster assembly scaffold protein [Pseudomonadota bacterium]